MFSGKNVLVRITAAILVLSLMTGILSGCSILFPRGRDSIISRIINTIRARDSSDSDNVDNIVYADDVTNLMDTSPDVLTYTDDGETVTVSSGIFKRMPKPGEIIILPPDIWYPGGRAIKVATASSIGNSTNIQIEEPLFEEVFEVLDFKTAFTPNVEEIANLYNARQAVGIGYSEPLSDHSAQKTNPSAQYSFLSNDSEPEKILDMTIGENSISLELGYVLSEDDDNNLTINGKVEIGFGEDIVAQYEGYESIDKWVSIDVDIPITVTTDVSVKGKLEKNIPAKIGAPIVIITPVPGVTINLQLYFTVGVTGELKIGFVHTAKMSFGVTGSLPHEFFDATLDFDDRSFPDFNELELSISGKAVLQLKSSISVAGIFDILTITPEAGVGINVKLEPLICPNIDVSIYLLVAIAAEFGTWKPTLNILAEGDTTPTNFYLVANNDDIAFYPGECPHITGITPDVSPSSPAEPTPAPASQSPLPMSQSPTASLDAARIGDMVQFGDYVWRVLDERNGRKLVITDRIIENRVYHAVYDTPNVIDYEDITWEDSLIRGYLNNEFYNSFTQNDRERIAPVTNSNPNNPWIGTPGGNDTQDYIFLLSVFEVVQYFGDSGYVRDPYSYSQQPSHDLFGPQDTDKYYVWQFIDDAYNDARIALRIEQRDDWYGGEWVLRTPGEKGSLVIYIGREGFIHMDGCLVNDSVMSGIRPAMWLTLD